MVLAVTYPWASASSYLSSQSVADSRCNLLMPGLGTGDLSRIGYALGGTRARLGVLFVLPSVSLALGHYSSDHSSEGLLGDRPRSGAGLGRMGSGHSPVRL